MWKFQSGFEKNKKENNEFIDDTNRDRFGLQFEINPIISFTQNGNFIIIILSTLREGGHENDIKYFKCSNFKC